MAAGVAFLVSGLSSKPERNFSKLLRQMIIFKMHLSIVLNIKYRPKMLLIYILKS